MQESPLWPWKTFLLLSDFCWLPRKKLGGRNMKVYWRNFEWAIRLHCCSKEPKNGIELLVLLQEKWWAAHNFCLGIFCIQCRRWRQGKHCSRKSFLESFSWSKEKKELDKWYALWTRGLITLMLNLWDLLLWKLVPRPVNVGFRYIEVDNLLFCLEIK